VTDFTRMVAADPDCASGASSVLPPPVARTTAARGTNVHNTEDAPHAAAAYRRVCRPVLARERPLDRSARRRLTEEAAMNARTRFFIGGLGAMVPILVNLIVVDLETQRMNVTVLSVASYVIRLAALFASGGIAVTFFNTDVHEPPKLFQLGIVAPALLTALINGHNVDPAQAARTADPAHPIAQIRIEQEGSGWQVSDLLGRSAYAQGSMSVAQATPALPRHRQFTLPEETARQQISRGLFGATPRNVWFVIVGSHLKEANADALARSLRTKGYEADIYEPYGGNPYYAVVIGAQMTLEDASKLRQQAVARGLPADAYLWTIPK
jgi:hypothetical protein